MPEDISQERAFAFREEFKAIDSEVLATAMGGDEPPEEPLLSTFEEGFGYFTAAAVNSSLRDYQFVRKLGWAVSSSVWLALDKSAETRTFAAMKLLTAHATAQIALGHSPEYDVFHKVESTNPKSPGFNHYLTLQRCFTAESEAGSHICFVTEALSSSLANLQKPGQNRFPLPIAKRITKQVLLALDYLHRECGYTHTDLKADNILASILPPANSRIEKYVLENDPTIYGPPLHLKSSDLPLVFSRSQPLPYFELGGTLENISVRLVDYGQATLAAKPVRGDFCQPPIVRAPEVTLKYPWTSAIDIWTVGCLLFQLLTEHHLFGQNLEDFFQHLKVLDEDEIPGAADFIRKCLTLDPKLRPTAQELLKDDWLL
ncbi:Serine/threonine-protein kinase SRPK [Leucoagaricus sp. SymC.cos]|nr:Serine/threonine-protein kinase SRPK [Leucoagaricus sp. SymC.cos]